MKTTAIVMRGLAVLAVLFLGACASVPNSGNMTMRGAKAEAKPPVPVTIAANIPKNQSTYHYMVSIYPGLDENFNPDPKLSLAEYNQLSQLDWYCARETDRLEGSLQEMLKQGTLYGGFEGGLGALGYKLGFGSLIHPSDYLLAIGLTAAGGGLASGKITVDTMLNVAHGYCMTGMVYKADQLEHKLSRLFITPLYTGKARLPQVSDAPAPTYSRTGGGRYIPPPPR